MGDQDTRELERRLEAGGDDLSRHNLTKDCLRKRRGIVAWWPGAMKPHDSAIRTTLAYESVNSVTRERHTETSTGWSVAVGGAVDIFDFSLVAREATLLDLATGRWLKMQGRRASVDFGLVAQEQVTTLDPLGRPRSTVRATPRSHDSDRTAYAQEGMWGTTWTGLLREQSIYDTEIVGADVFQTNAFRNFAAFAHRAPGAPEVKYWGLDCNLYGPGGSLPRGHCFDATGVSVALLAPDRQPLPEAEARRIASVCTITLNLAATRFVNWPLEQVLFSHDDRPAESAVVLHDRPAPPVIPFAWPLRLQETEQFDVQITFPSGLRGVFAERHFVFVKVTLHGFLASPRSG